MPGVSGRSRNGSYRRENGSVSPTYTVLVKVGAIAREVDRSPATVSRELRPNVDTDSGTYRPHTAQWLAEQRRVRPKIGKLVADVELREFVRDKLKRRWSPGQIAQTL